MHTNTTRRHRHFVAVPLTAFAILALAGVSAFLPVRAEEETGKLSVHLHAEKDQPFRIDTSVVGTLYAGSLLRADRTGTRMSLLQGQMLVRQQGHMTVDVGEMHVYALDASFFIVKDSRSTIAALDEPLLVVFHDETKIVFKGQQLLLMEDGSTSIASLPAEWQVERMHELQAMHPDEAHAQTSDLYIQRFRASTSAFEKRLILLHLISLGKKVDEEVIPDMVRTLQDDEVLRDLFPSMLPSLAVTSQKSLHPEIVSAWADDVIEWGLRDGTGAALLLHQVASVPSFVEEAGYPIQASLWRDAMRHAVRILQPTVSPENSELLSKARDVFSAEEITVMPIRVPEEEEPKPETTWSADELSLLTRQALVSYGALIATSTAFVPDVQKQVVHVQGIYVAEQGKDVPYSFTYDPVKEELRSINRDGTRLPNVVPLAVFFR